MSLKSRIATNKEQREYELKRYLWRQTCREQFGLIIPEIAGRGKQHDNTNQTTNYSKDIK